LHQILWQWHQWHSFQYILHLLRNNGVYVSMIKPIELLVVVLHNLRLEKICEFLYHLKCILAKTSSKIGGFDPNTALAIILAAER